MNTTLHIRARRAEIAQTDAVNTQPAGATGSVQWMPPGNHTIDASANGVAKKVNVTADEETALLVDKRIKEMISAARGNAGLPYIDFDHSDGEAAGWPQSAYWAGNDALKGGVRLNVEWSDAGREKIRGKSYQGFSPEFMLKNGKVSDVGINLGGLVNRPAFTGIQRVTARASDDGYIAENKTDLITVAARLQVERGIKNITEAVNVAARENPLLYSEYIAGLNGEALRLATVDVPGKFHDVSPFTITAKRIASERRLDIVDAATILAREQPDLYLQYCDSLGFAEPAPIRAKKSRPSYGEEQAAKARAVIALVDTTDLMVQARKTAVMMRISLIDATRVVAGEKPELYEQYVDTLGCDEVAPIRAQKRNPYLTPSEEKTIRAMAVAERTDLVIQARALAEETRTHFVDALLIVARDKPELYQQYVDSLGRSEPAPIRSKRHTS